MKRRRYGAKLWFGVFIVCLVLAVASVVAMGIAVVADEGAGGSGGTNWVAVVTGVGTVLFGALSGLFGVKWRQGVKFLKETSEALVAVGLCGAAMATVLEKPGDATAEQISALLDEVRRVGTEFKEAIQAGKDFFQSFHKVQLRE